MHKILYFSGTGNTAYLAKHIESGLIKKGLDVSRERIETSDAQNCSNIETLYLGFPVYGCDMPVFVHNYIKSLPEGAGAPVRLFCTYAFYTGKAMQRAAVMFTEKGYSVTTFYRRKMPGTDGLAFLKKDGRTAKKLLSNFNDDMTDLYKWMEDDRVIKEMHTSFDLGGRIVGGMMKAAERFIKKKYRADERCISCGLCVRNCPVGNIKMIDKKIQFGNECILCMRCIHQCPVEAVQIGRMTVDKFRYKGPTGRFKPE